MKDKGCDHCVDPDGNNCYPYYGLAPHRHDLNITGHNKHDDSDITGYIIGSTVLEPKENWPENFIADSGAAGLGTYIRCPFCGASRDN